MNKHVTGYLIVVCAIFMLSSCQTVSTPTAAPPKSTPTAGSPTLTPTDPPPTESSLVEAVVTSPTPCPPALTPERSMPEEAGLIQEHLEAAGLDQVQVAVTGFQNCPDIKTAEALGWIEIRVTVSDTAGPDRFGEVIDMVQDSTTDWPKATIFLTFYDQEKDVLASLDFTNQDIQDLQAAGNQGAELYEALLD